MSPMFFRSPIRGALTAVGLLMLGAMAWAGSTEVYFSPEGGCTDAVVSLSKAAKAQATSNSMISSVLTLISFQECIR